MEIPNTSTRTCVLRVNAKCCNACRNNAKRKLQSVPGVREVECNEEGLIRVEGEVNPARLLRRVEKWGRNHKWGRNAEIVSVQNNQPFAHDRGHQMSHVPENPPPQSHCFLLRSCFGMKPRKPKVQPLMETRNWHFAPAPPPAVYPPPQAMNGPLPVPYPPPRFGALSPHMHYPRF
ncbi:PREDICTED: uncharacterized protein LOC104802224 [Tarenaya hassleriana]|uniref:uncharacterized protein LOC104802224 n=1 Tax=Tarenaya hassleriana TaxID=28532 RepID=UPI00053C0909|nr:PREDICTED: uncharacterized protein LOC104802224 [Tarenaya hassleriana]